MKPEEFFKRLEDHQFLYLSGSDRKVFLKKEHSGTYLFGGKDFSFLSIAKTCESLTVDDRMVFFYNWLSEAGGKILAFQTRTDVWEAGE